jgi:NAD(P)-dependent dehydrogenase (short-subunit alcohol dehydrogenase family)
VGEPEDIGKVIAFLVSEDAAWITGQDIQVAGGYSL